MALIGLLGDIHGSTFWLDRALNALLDSEVEAIWQVGDLGIWPGEDHRKWDRVQGRLALAGIPMLVAPGNHEDYDQIDALPARDDGWLEFRENILLAPRGHRTVVAGLSILWLGGAGSIDRSYRLDRDAKRNRWLHDKGSAVPLKSWWPQEVITAADAERSIAGGSADIMVCHDAPRPVPGIELRARGIDPEDLRRSDASTQLLTGVVEATQPKLLIHGHHHVRMDSWYTRATGDRTRTIGLDCDGRVENVALFELNTLDVSASRVTWWSG